MSGFGNFDIGKIMEQAQQMAQKVEETRARLADMKVEAESGGGLVRVVATGDQNVEKITIDPKAIDPNEAEVLEDLVTVAVREAVSKAKELQESEMSKITGGLGGPGMNLPNMGM